MSRRGNLAIGWTLAVLAIALFVRLGLWQSQRALEKQAQLDAVARVLRERDPQPLARAAELARRRGYDWAEGAGRFADSGALWLDNQQRGGRAGVQGYRVFLPEQGAPMLVDLGWQPLPADRTLPAVPRPDGRVQLRGLLAPPPSAGLALGSGVQARDDGWLLTRIDTTALSTTLRLPTALAPRVLRLDPALPLGHERDLQVLGNTLPPEKHRGYALQWFALATAVLATALILTFRKARHDRT